jgi:hypothetical protein
MCCNAVHYFFWLNTLLFPENSTRLVAANTMVTGISNSKGWNKFFTFAGRISCHSPSNSLSRVRRQVLFDRVGGGNRRSGLTTVAAYHGLGFSTLPLSRSIRRHTATTFPICASVTEATQDDYNSSVARRSYGDVHYKQTIDSSFITEGLNPSQVEATLRPRYSITRVIAGPGAGKTKVLTCRIAHLLLDSEGNNFENNGYSRPPEGILAVTFTKKAAMEMERRLSELLSSSTKVMFEEEQTNGASLSPPSISSVADEAIVIHGNVDSNDNEDSNDSSRQLMRQTTVGTFHSVCSKILRKFGDELGNLPSVRECTIPQPIQNEGNKEGEQATNSLLVQTLDGSFNIIDQTDQLRILKDILKEHNIELSSNDAMSRGRRLDDLRPITILNAISLLNTEDAVLRTPQKNARKDTISQEVAEKMSKRVQKIAIEIRIPFQKAKYAQNSVDFDDLIFLTRELLLFHPEVREVLHRRWRHILVE